MAGLPQLRWSTTLRRADELLAFCQAAAEFMRAVGRLEILSGELVTVSFTAASSATVKHHLGRPFKGALVVASTAPAATPSVHALDAVSAGSSARQQVTLQAASAFTATLTVWVF